MSRGEAESRDHAVREMPVPSSVPVPGSGSGSGSVQAPARVRGDDEGYSGLALLTVGSARFEVAVELRGYFEPIDGRYHWYGRIAKNDELMALLGGGRGSGVIDTGEGASPCDLSEPDLWNRYRVTGISTPPFSRQPGIA